MKVFFGALALLSSLLISGCVIREGRGGGDHSWNGYGHEHWDHDHWR